MRQVVKLFFGLVVTIPLLFGESNEMKTADPQENKILSRFGEKDLKGLFNKKSEADILESFFGKRKYELITNIDLNGDGKVEKLYGEKYEIEFNRPLGKDKFNLKKIICLENLVKIDSRILFIADEDKILTKDRTFFSFSPYQGESFLRWWFLGLYTQLIKENAFLVSMDHIVDREKAKRYGGGPAIKHFVLRWNPKTEDFEVDEELSKKYGY